MSAEFRFSYFFFSVFFVISKAFQSLKTSTNWLILIAKRSVFFHSHVSFIWTKPENERSVLLPRCEHEMSFALVMRCFATVLSFFFYFFVLAFRWHHFEMIRYWMENKFSASDQKRNTMTALERAHDWILLRIAMTANFAASFSRCIWRCAWLTHPWANTVPRTDSSTDPEIAGNDANAMRKPKVLNTCKMVQR